jgi:hypothetical protein
VEAQLFGRSTWVEGVDGSFNIRYVSGEEEATVPEDQVRRQGEQDQVNTKG